MKAAVACVPILLRTMGRCCCCSRSWGVSGFGPHCGAGIGRLRQLSSHCRAGTGSAASPGLWSWPVPCAREAGGRLWARSWQCVGLRPGLPRARGELRDWEPPLHPQCFPWAVLGGGSHSLPTLVPAFASPAPSRILLRGRAGLVWSCLQSTKPQLAPGTACSSRRLVQLWLLS